MNGDKRKALILLLFMSLPLFVYAFGKRGSSSAKTSNTLTTETAALRSFSIEVQGVGTLEAARSNLIFSSLRGDQGKIIYLINDGTSVKKGDLLVKMDPTPFEEAIEHLKAATREQECKIAALEQAIESEICQTEHEVKSAKFEARSAKLELSKVTKGDCPQELARVQASLQKAKAKYEEFKSYSEELKELEDRGFLNPTELQQAKKKLEEEKETFELISQEHNALVKYVHPMRIEKANTALQRARCKLEEVTRLSAIKIAKDRALLEHAQYELEELQCQLENSYAILAMTEIKAPAPGIVVHREEFRNGQKRKPRPGDVVVKNQPILDLPDLDSIIVKSKVREADLFKIDIGKPVVVTVDAYPQLTLRGKINSIGVLALSDASKSGDEKYFDLLIELEKGDPKLRPGMTSRLLILADKVDDKLTIPVYAVFEKEGCHYCYLSKGRGFALQPIEIGASNEYWVEVVKGIKPNDKVSVTAPPKELLITSKASS